LSLNKTNHHSCLEQVHRWCICSYFDPNIESNYPGRGPVSASNSTIPIREKPDIGANVVRSIFEDEVILVIRTVVGTNPYRINQRFYETHDGYIWVPDTQLVKNIPNIPVLHLPDSNLGAGIWAEVTVPYVDLKLENRPARAPWLINRMGLGLQPRFFYSQVVWVDSAQIDENDQAWYRGNERYGYGDFFLAPAEAFRPIAPEDVAPISPEVEKKWW
jgi:hypothetical protein